MRVSSNRATPIAGWFIMANPSTNKWWLAVPLWLRKPPYGCFNVSQGSSTPNGGIFHVVLHNRFPVLYPAVVEAVEAVLTRWSAHVCRTEALDCNVVPICSNMILDLILYIEIDPNPDFLLIWEIPKYTYHIISYIYIHTHLFHISL